MFQLHIACTRPTSMLLYIQFRALLYIQFKILLGFHLFIMEITPYIQVLHTTTAYK